MSGYSHHIHLTSCCPSDSLAHWTLLFLSTETDNALAYSYTKGYSAMSYKVEELLALRDSVSESAVSIDRFADEDSIKGQF
jgi:hypothetical protein